MITKLYTDGACRGNPGKGACAWILTGRKIELNDNNTDATKEPLLYIYDGSILFQSSIYIGQCTNNIAEYCAILYGLISLVPSDIKSLVITSDSELVINQLNGTYQCNSESLKFYNTQVKQLIKDHFTSVQFEHAPRTDSFIAQCDKLCNEKLDRIGGK